MRENYGRIINMPHHTSATRQRMTELGRAAQFAPFAALTGLGAEVSEKARITESETELASDECDEINRRLLAASENSEAEVEITYFEPDSKKEGGCYRTVVGAVRQIDPIEGYLILNGKKKIPLFRIVAICGDLFDE